MKGIVSSELIVTFRTSLSFEPNAPVILRVSGAYSMQFSTHYISRISRKGDKLTIHAFDLMRRLENPFDDSIYNESGEPFTASLVLENLARQCGFSDFADLPAGVQTLRYSDIHGKKCREILGEISRYGVGAWYCSNDERLRFVPFLSALNGIQAQPQRTAAVYLHSKKGPFRSVYAENTVSGEVYSAGSSPSDYRYALKLAGKLITRERTTQIMSSVAGKSYQAFYCAHIGLTDAPEGITGFYSDEYPDGLISCHTTVRFGAGEIYAEAKAADICEDEWDYTDLTGYELRKKVERFREYGSTVMTDKGIGILSDTASNDPTARLTYFFSSAADAVTAFDGAIIDKTMPDAIESLSDTMKKFVYGDSVYILSFDRDENGKMTNIQLTKETA